MLRARYERMARARREGEPAGVAELSWFRLKTTSRVEQSINSSTVPSGQAPVRNSSSFLELFEYPLVQSFILTTPSSNTMKIFVVCCLLIGAAIAAEEPAPFQDCFEKDSIACVQVTVRHSKFNQPTNQKCY